MEEIEDDIQVKTPAVPVKPDLIIGELFKMHYISLCNYAHYFLKDDDDSEDVVQGVFYQLWKMGKPLEISASIKSYLFTAVKNNCLKRINHIKIENRYKENVLFEPEIYMRAIDHAETRELEKQIKNAINSLPDQCRLVFTLSRQQGLKYSEIAKQLTISEKTVENHMGKALRILKEKLKDYL